MNILHVLKTTPDHEETRNQTGGKIHKMFFLKVSCYFQQETLLLTEHRKWRVFRHQTNGKTTSDHIKGLFKLLQWLISVTVFSTLHLNYHAYIVTVTHVGCDVCISLVVDAVSSTQWGLSKYMQNEYLVICLLYTYHVIIA